jgi:hypothetical protein
VARTDQAHLAITAVKCRLSANSHVPHVTSDLRSPSCKACLSKYSVRKEELSAQDDVWRATLLLSSLHPVLHFEKRTFTNFRNRPKRRHMSGLRMANT